MSPRASDGRRNPATALLALGAVLLFAVSAACSSEPDPTATTQPPTATAAPTATSAPMPTTPPAADPTEAPTGQDAGSASLTETPAAGLDPDATVSGEIAASPPPDPTEAPTAEPTAAAAPEAPPVGVNVGDTLPHFEMTLADGSRVSTEVLAAQGQPVFLYFWATW